MTRRVCLFGTSADPPTGEGGHIGIARALSNMNEFDQVNVLPVYRHTFANKRNRLIPFKDRFEMCRLAFEGIPRVVVSDAERACFQRKAEGKSEEEILGLRVGTADLLDMLLEAEPNTEFSFALGADTFMDLTNWKWRRSKDVLEQLGGRFLVMFREGSGGVARDVLNERIGQLNRSMGASARLLAFPDQQAVSSTLVRSSNNVEMLRSLLAPTVLKYIQDHKLYAFSEMGRDE